MQTGNIQYKYTLKKEPANREYSIQIYTKERACKQGISNTNIHERKNMQTGNIQYKYTRKKEHANREYSIQIYSKEGTCKQGIFNTNIHERKSMQTGNIQYKYIRKIYINKLERRAPTNRKYSIKMYLKKIQVYLKGEDINRAYSIQKGELHDDYIHGFTLY